LIGAYVDKLIYEIHCLDLASIGSGRIADLKTIYFGGGTPSLLSISNFQSLISNLKSLIPNFSSLEISIEANPGTVNKEYLKVLHNLGINRISLGAQSFNDKHLKTLGRIHDSKQIYKAVEDAKSAGFKNISIDFIFAIPNQTLNEWKHDLEQAVKLEPKHISTYNLQIEEGTPLFKTLSFKGRRDYEEDLDAEMYEYTMDFLKSHGYKHYEISNFAELGFESKHNLNYWQNGNYLGIGAGAHSHIDGKRWNNTESIEEYLLLDCKGGSRTTPTGKDSSETLFMGLRLIDGIPTQKFKGYEEKMSKLIKANLLEHEGNNIKLSKRGLMLANLVFEEFV